LSSFAGFSHHFRRQKDEKCRRDDEKSQLRSEAAGRTASPPLEARRGARGPPSRHVNIREHSSAFVNIAVNIAPRDCKHRRAIRGRGHARAAHAEKAWRRAAARTRARVSMIEIHNSKELRRRASAARSRAAFETDSKPHVIVEQKKNIVKRGRLCT
jgi:hypothetical protein